MTSTVRFLKSFAAALFIWEREKRSERLKTVVAQAMEAISEAGPLETVLVIESEGEQIFVSTDQTNDNLSAIFSQEKSRPLVAHMARIFASAEVRKLAFSRWPDAEELTQIVRLLCEVESHMQLHLVAQKISGTFAVSHLPSLAVKAELSDDVVEALDALFLVMLGIDRHGAPDESGPQLVIRGLAEFLLADLGGPSAREQLMTHLDEVLHDYPNPVQRGVQDLFLQALDPSERKALVASSQPESLFDAEKAAIEALRAEVHAELHRDDDVDELGPAKAGGDQVELAIPVKRVRDSQGIASAIQPVDEWVRSYREFGPQLVRRAENLLGLDGYEDAIGRLAEVGAKLISDGKVSEAVPIISIVSAHKHRTESYDDATKRVVKAAYAAVFNTRMVEALVEKLPTAPFKEQGALLALLTGCGEEAIEALTRLVIKRHLTGACKTAVIACLEAGGATARRVITETLENQGVEATGSMTLVEILGTVGDTTTEAWLRGLSRHRDSRVRRTALMSLYKLRRHNSEPTLLAALSDRDSSVCQIALTLLSAVNCSAPEFTGLVEAFISADTPDDVREEGIAIAAIRSLRLLGNIQFPSGDQAEHILLRRLGVRLGSKGKSRFRRVGEGLSLRVQTAIVETLGTIGTASALEALESLSATSGPVIQHHAGHAQQAIMARGG